MISGAQDLYGLKKSISELHTKIEDIYQVEQDDTTISGPKHKLLCVTSLINETLKDVEFFNKNKDEDCVSKIQKCVKLISTTISKDITLDSVFNVVISLYNVVDYCKLYMIAKIEYDNNQTDDNKQKMNVMEEAMVKRYNICMNPVYVFNCKKSSFDFDKSRGKQGQVSKLKPNSTAIVERSDDEEEPNKVLNKVKKSKQQELQNSSKQKEESKEY